MRPEQKLIERVSELSDRLKETAPEKAESAVGRKSKASLRDVLYTEIVRVASVSGNVAVGVRQVVQGLDLADDTSLKALTIEVPSGMSVSVDSLIVVEFGTSGYTAIDLPVNVG